MQNLSLGICSIRKNARERPVRTASNRQRFPAQGSQPTDSESVLHRSLGLAVLVSFHFSPFRSEYSDEETRAAIDIFTHAVFYNAYRKTKLNSSGSRRIPN